MNILTERRKGAMRIELFVIEMEMGVVFEFLGLNLRRDGEGGKVEGFIV